MQHQPCIDRYGALSHRFHLSRNASDKKGDYSSARKYRRRMLSKIRLKSLGNDLKNTAVILAKGAKMWARFETTWKKSLRWETSDRGARRARGGSTSAEKSSPKRMGAAGRSIGQTLQGSFSAVSKPNFASRYSFESSRRDLHNTVLCTALQSQFCHFLINLTETIAKLCKKCLLILLNLGKI